MKGIIVISVKSLVKEKFGLEKWFEILEASGIDRFINLNASIDFDDDLFFKVAENACKILEITPKQLTDAFGEYWVNEYAPRIYPNFYEDLNSSRDYILKVNEIHKFITKNMQNSKPPRFEYDWLNENHLKIHYISDRNMIEFFIGLLKGIRTYFKDEFEVKKLNDSEVEVIWN
jgi:hypothetical protein